MCWESFLDVLSTGYCNCKSLYSLLTRWSFRILYISSQTFEPQWFGFSYEINMFAYYFSLNKIFFNMRLCHGWQFGLGLLKWLDCLPICSTIAMSIIFYEEICWDSKLMLHLIYKRIYLIYANWLRSEEFSYYDNCSMSHSVSTSSRFLGCMIIVWFSVH